MMNLLHMIEGCKRNGAGNRSTDANRLEDLMVADVADPHDYKMCF